MTSKSKMVRLAAIANRSTSGRSAANTGKGRCHSYLVSVTKGVIPVSAAAILGVNLAITIVLAGFAFTSPAYAVPVIAYEWTEGGPGNGTNSIHPSLHGVGGPVLADDFRPAVSGWVTQIDWWGTVATSSQWEITFHSDAGGIPAATAPTGGISQHFVTSAGSDLDGDGVFFYSAAWVPMDIFLNAGTSYWFSTANFNSGWNWANAGGAGPTVGGEANTAVVSTGIGPNGGPHFGPWNQIFTPAGAKQDFAFRIWVEAPEPGTLAIFVLGLAGLALMRRRRAA